MPFYWRQSPTPMNRSYLLRIQKEARLPAAPANDQTRQESIEDIGKPRTMVRSTSRLGERQRCPCMDLNVQCTRHVHRPRQCSKYRYAEDIDNYYSVNQLMVWKPDATTLDLIVNHQHRTNDIPIGNKATKIGRTRFAAAEREYGTKVDFKINPTDIMKRRHRLLRHVSLWQIQRSEDCS